MMTFIFPILEFSGRKTYIFITVNILFIIMIIRIIMFIIISVIKVGLKKSQ